MNGCENVNEDGSVKPGEWAKCGELVRGGHYAYGFMRVGMHLLGYRAWDVVKLAGSGHPFETKLFRTLSEAKAYAEQCVDGGHRD